MVQTNVLWVLIGKVGKYDFFHILNATNGYGRKF